MDSKGGMYVIERYTRKCMADIWSEHNKYDVWLKIELLACEAWHRLGIIPRDDMEALRTRARIDAERAKELEKVVRHDVIAFTRAVSEGLGEERKWVHYGLTSSDVVDTATGFLLKCANDIIEEDLVHFIGVLRDKALKHKYTVMAGRTHGVHAEPITFGLKMALWHEEMKRNLQRFRNARKEVEVGKISGATGTYASVDPFVELHVCESLGIEPCPISTQVVQRDRHAHYISVLAVIASSLEKFATEIRSLQRSEIREVEEFFAEGQKGSSAMPHKRNPISAENICGLARVVKSHAAVALDNVVLWHERDISHSSAERIVFPDCTTLIDYMLNRFSRIVENLTVNEQNMLDNMDRTFGLMFSGRVLTKLVDKGFSREYAYDLVQPLAMESWNRGRLFKEVLWENEQIRKIISAEELEECFDVTFHLRHVDLIFQRLGLE